MGVLRRLAWTAATLALVAGAAACFDLFHSTDGIEPGCVLDAAACRDAAAPPSDAGADGATGFCAWSRDEARANAAHACAWLGACESPLGENAFGACMFDALLAYDCADNPSYPVTSGPPLAYWGCLWQAQSCEDVDQCVFPSGTKPVCPTAGDYTGCAGDLRVECTDAGVPLGEVCAAQGERCGTGAGMGACTGNTSSDGGLGCAVTECDGTLLHQCSGSSDVGRDCASIGGGACGGFPTSGPTWVACLPVGDAGCNATTTITCSSGIATTCAAGIPATINCEALLQVPEVSNCTAGTLSPPYDWTSPCEVTPPACKTDSCDGGVLTGCTRGAPFQADCAALGLGACHLVATDVGTETHAACSPP